jgi:hypothetical protein
MSQAFFSEAGEMAPADAATLVPSSRTVKKVDQRLNVYNCRFLIKCNLRTDFLQVLRIARFPKKLSEVAAWKIIR